MFVTKKYRKNCYFLSNQDNRITNGGPRPLSYIPQIYISIAVAFLFMSFRYSTSVTVTYGSVKTDIEKFL